MYSFFGNEKSSVFVSLILISILISARAFAAPSSSSSYASFESFYPEEGYYSETGITLSSLADGAGFLSAGVFYDFGRWLNLGFRGMLPININADSQVYTAEAISRLQLSESEDQMHVEGSFGIGFSEDSYSSGVHVFPFAGVSYGYSRVLTDTIAVGGSFGVLLGSNSESKLFNNRYSINGTYRF